MIRGLVAAVLIAGLVAAGGVAVAQPTRLADLAQKVTDLEAKVAKLEASDATNSQAIAEITTRLAEIAQELSRLAAQGDSRADLVRRVDELGLKLNTLERELETLRTQLANLEQPEVTPSSGTYYDRGFVLVDGDFSLKLDGYAQTRWRMELPKEADTVNVNTFELDRARIGLSGKLGSVLGRKVRFRYLHDLDRGALDAYVDVAVIPELSIRVGQDRIRATRAFTVSNRRMAFATRTQTENIFRYDREPGLFAHGRFLDERFGYWAGFANGAARSASNDNIDLTAVARVDAAVLGAPIGYRFGDLERTDEPAITVGASAVHDLVRVPEQVAGLPVGNRDVDNDLVFDNVRVISASVDAVFRLQGLEVYAEGMLRHERWGTILLHSDNQDLADQVNAGDDGNKTYLAITGHANYFVLPERLLIGSRVTYGEQPLLGLGGRQRDVIPIGTDLFELDVMTSYWHNGLRFLTFQYTLTNFNNPGGTEAAFDVEHRLLVESQLSF